MPWTVSNVELSLRFSRRLSETGEERICRVIESKLLKELCNNSTSMASSWRSWLRRPPSNQEGPDSGPAGGTIDGLKSHNGLLS